MSRWSIYPECQCGHKASDHFYSTDRNNQFIRAVFNCSKCKCEAYRMPEVSTEFGERDASPEKP